jgi:outer membrane lipoprotein-sorting protein
VIGGGAAIGTLAANAEPSLPERSAAQLLVDLQTARLEGLSGTVVQRADLGLPELPAIAGMAGTGLTSLVSGSNTVRVWYNGPEQARLALLSTLGETDVIRNGRDVWIWSSRGNSAQHYRLPADHADHPTPTLSPSGLPVPGTPQEAAEMALAAIEPTTEVTTGRNAQVAGRDAYELVLAPRDKNSLIGQLRLGIDATEHLPLRVEVFPKGSDEPAFEVKFTQISFDRPDAERFRFNPPPGVKVSEESADDAAKEAEKAAKEATKEAEKEAREHAKQLSDDDSTLIGEGWTSVFVARTGDDDLLGSLGKSGESGAGGEDAAAGLALVDQMTKKVSGPWGNGRLLSSKLFTVLFTTDGRVLAGAVSPERLYEVAGSAEAKLK